MSDASGCSSVVSIAVAQPGQLDVETFPQHSSCSTASDGQIAWVVEGGTSPYSLQVLNGTAIHSSNQLRANGLSNPFALQSTVDTVEVDSLPSGSYTWVVTDANGCNLSGLTVLTQPANPCQVTVSVRLFIEGFYDGSETMRSLPGLPGAFTDTLMLQVRSSTPPYSLMLEESGLVDTTGWAIFSFSATLWQQSVYFVLRHRNALETWSKSPVFIPSGVKNYIWSENINPPPSYFRKK